MALLSDKSFVSQLDFRKTPFSAILTIEVK